MADRNTMMAEQGAPLLEILSGEERGKVFELTLERISIGRADDNEIAITSDAISRHHAVLERTMGGAWMIADQGSKNGISVNGTRVKEAELSEGDVVQVGDFVFRFTQGGMGGGAPSPIEPEMGISDGEVAAPFALSGQAAPKRKFNTRTLILGIVLVGGLLYLFMGKAKPPEQAGDDASQTASADGASTDAKQKAPEDFKETPNPDLANASEPAHPTGSNDPALTDAEQYLSRIDNTNDPLKMGEQFFRSGQREYLNHNWQSAITDFKTTLSLTRGHEMAKKYLALAMHSSEDEAKMHMQNGIRYFDSLQYRRAMEDFQQVIQLMAHRPSEPIIGLAEKYIAICKQRLAAAEQFP